MKFIELLDALEALKTEPSERPDNPAVVLGYEDNYGDIARVHYSERMNCLLITEEEDCSTPYYLAEFLSDLEEYQLALRNVNVVGYFGDGHALVRRVFYDARNEHITISLEPEHSPIIENDTKHIASTIENDNKTAATLAELQQRVERLEYCSFNLFSNSHKDILNKYLDKYFTAWASESTVTNSTGGNKEMLNRYLNTYIATWVAYEQRPGGRLDRSYTRYTGDED